MFGIKELVRRIERLEVFQERIKQKECCDNGLHEWQMQEVTTYNRTPYVRCKFCFKKPEEKI